MTKFRKPIRSTLMATVMFAALSACGGNPGDPLDRARDAQGMEELRGAQIALGKLLSEEPGNVEARMAAGDVAMRLDNFERAMSEYGEVPAGDPMSPRARTMVAKAALMLGNPRRAAEELEGLDSDLPLTDSVRIALAFGQGEMEQGRAMLGTALAAYPDAPELLLLSAEQDWLAGDRQEAAGKIARALDAAPDDSELHLMAGRFAMDNRELDTAKTHFDRVLALRPNHQTAMIAQAAVARDSGDDGAAAEWIDKANKAGKPSPVAVYFAAQISYDAGDIARAHELLQAVRKAGRNLPQIVRLDGLIAAHRGQTQTAIGSLEDYMEMGGDGMLVRRVLAGQYIEAGNDRRAWETLQPVLGRADADANVLALGARLADQFGDAQAAALQARATNAAKTAPPTAIMVEAGKAMRAGDWTKADTLYAPLLEESQSAVLLNNAANVKLQIGENEAAIALARRALALAPDDPGVLDTMGWVLLQTGGPRSEAREHLTRARALAPQNGEIYEHLRLAQADGEGQGEGAAATGGE